MLGASTVFGVGASHDRMTIPSLLNRHTGTTWYNYGARAYNSTQEAILFALHMPTDLRKLVLFSGINNLTLSLLSQRSSPVYNSLFGESTFRDAFEQALMPKAAAPVTLRQMLGHNWRWLKARFQGTPSALPRPLVEATPEEKYIAILSSFRRDLTLLRDLALARNFSLYFAFQPVASYLDRKLAQQEETIFTALDSVGQDWQVLASHITQYRARYLGDIAELCRELNVPFCDMNAAPEFRSSDWLFVDRVHLTDLGNELAARILKKEFGL